MAQNTEDMNRTEVFAWILNQSPAIIILLGLSWLLWSQNERAHIENKACNQAIIQIYQEQNNRMIEALEGIEYYIQTTQPSKKNK